MYALTVNPNIYVSIIKQFWSSVVVKKVNDVSRLQALLDRKKVMITEATIRDALHLDDAEGIDCLPNEEIFTELARMGYKKPSTKLTFYKAFFSSQLKFLIHTILQCMSAKRTSWNEFSSSMASAIICLSTGKGCSRVETPLFEGMIMAQQVGEGADEVNVDDVYAVGVADKGEIIKLINAAKDITLKDVDAIVKDVKDAEIEESSDVQGRKAESQAQIYQIDLEHADKVLSMQDDDIEPAELQEVVEVVTTAKLITEVVTAASATITVAAPTLTTAPSAARRRKGVVIRDPEETATPSIIIHSKAKSKDKGNVIFVEEPKPLKKKNQIEKDEAYYRELEAELNKTINWDDVIDQVQRKEKEKNYVMRYQALKRKPQTEAQARKNMMIYLRNMAGFKMDYFKGMKYDDICPIFEKYFNSNKIDEEVEEIRKHLQIVPNDDDVYTEATSLALKVPVVDYQIHTENNKPYYKIKRADGSHQLYLSFLSMLRNFDREDLQVLWQLVKERFASSKPNNFLDDFLLTTLGAMFEKPDLQAQI
nr:xylulose kinase-1 [Tanacetum cinerariifolium]